MRIGTIQSKLLLCIMKTDYNRDAIYANYYNDSALTNLKAIKNKKVANVSTDALLAKSYHIGRGIYTIA